MPDYVGNIRRQQREGHFATIQEVETRISVVLIGSNEYAVNPLNSGLESDGCILPRTWDWLLTTTYSLQREQRISAGLEANIVQFDLDYLDRRKDYKSL